MRAKSYHRINECHKLGRAAQNQAQNQSRRPGAAQGQPIMSQNSIPEFKTRRLFLRGLQLRDAESYEKRFARWEIVQFLRRSCPWPYPKGGALAWIKTAVLPNQGLGQWSWGIFLKSRREDLIGCIELRRKGNPGNRGFWLAEEHWGKGLMTEACQPVLDYAFEALGFEKLIFDNAVQNLASRRVKEKTGCRYIGLRAQKFLNPEFAESEIWELSRADWQTFRGAAPAAKPQKNQEAKAPGKKPFSLSEEGLALIKSEMSRYEIRRSCLIPCLYQIQKEKGWIPPEAVPWLSARTGIPESQIYEVLTFYTMFNKKPVGRFHIQVCRNISCSLRGGRDLAARICRRLQIREGERSADGSWTLSLVECLGACDEAPAIQLNGELLGRMTEEKTLRILRERLTASKNPPAGSQGGQ